MQYPSQEAIHSLLSRSAKLALFAVALFLSAHASPVQAQTQVCTWDSYLRNWCAYYMEANTCYEDTDSPRVVGGPCALRNGSGPFYCSQSGGNQDCRTGYDQVDVSAVEWQCKCVTYYPNLSASTPTPAAASAGTAVLLKTTVSNSGTAGAGATRTRFQRATSSSGASAINIGSDVSTSAINAGASRAVSLSYTFPSDRVWYIRACADALGTVTESSENDNCSAWRAVAVGSAPPPAEECSFMLPANGRMDIVITVNPWITGDPSPSYPTYNINWGGGSPGGVSCTTEAADCVRGTHTHTYPGSGPYEIAISAGYVGGGPDLGTAFGFTVNGTVVGGSASASGGTQLRCMALPAARPNLVASLTTPTSAVAGTAVTYSTTVNNNGNTGAGATQTRFQRATSSAGAGAATVATISTSAINAGASRVVATSYTHAAAGTIYMRACADIAGVISESNESDNCSAWRAVTVSAPPLANLRAAATAPTTATAGVATTFSTTVTNSGTANAGSTQTRFQRATSAAGAGAATMGDVLTSAANVGVSRAVSISSTLTAGTWYVRACADITALVTESSETDNCSAWRAVTVSAPAQANLTAGAITPTTATADVATVFSTTVANSGTAPSGVVTPTLFQRATSAAGAGASSLGVTNNASLTAGQSRSVTRSATLPAGTWYLRACADNNASFVGTVTESNEADNCGAWTRVTVTAAGSVSCDVSETSVVPGESVTYTATPAGGAGVPYTWTGSGGGSYGTARTATRTFTVPGLYDMQVRATGADDQESCPRVSVEADWCTAGATSLEIEATPNRVRAGESVSLSWNASNVLGDGTTCTVTGPGVSWSAPAAVAPACDASDSASPVIETQSTYTLTCGASSESVTVNVIPNFDEF